MKRIVYSNFNCGHYIIIYFYLQCKNVNDNVIKMKSLILNSIAKTLSAFMQQLEIELTLPSGSQAIVKFQETDIYTSQEKGREQTNKQSF